MLGSRPKALKREQPEPDDEDVQLPVERATAAAAPPPAALGIYARCPRCKGAAEDGRALRHPFRGIACFWCGARIRIGDIPPDRWGEVVLVCEGAP